jgi:signal transduction histidine kinase
MGRVEPLAALGRITATIAHELGTPLNSILGHTQLLTREDLPEPMRRRLQTIESQVRRMADTIQYYLSRTRSSHRVDEPVDVNALVRETVALLQPSFQQHRVRVVCALAEALPWLSADRGSLQRVLINLLNNALDAMGTGGTVTITTGEELSAAARAGVVLEVTDTGAGMSPELVTKLFSLFTTTKEPGKGSGLGLAISQEIVQAHGGSIDITSRVGQGTTVRIILPTGAGAQHPAITAGEEV